MLEAMGSASTPCCSSHQWSSFTKFYLKISERLQDILLKSRRKQIQFQNLLLLKSSPLEFYLKDF